MSNATQPQQYREVSRKANAGERIKIVKERTTFGHYRNGDVLLVTRVDSDGDAYFPVEKRLNNPDGIMFAGPDEYVVLEPIVALAPVSVNLPDLFAQFIRDNAGAVRNYLAELEPVDSAEPVADVFEIKTPLTRAKVIEMARERVSELKRVGNSLHLDLPKGTPFHYRYYNVEFHVNRDKRTVTALVHVSGNQRKPNAVGIAKAAPDDVFNADIGKAIAAERVLGLAVTDAFVNAPKPEKATAGAIVSYEGRVRKIVPSNTSVVHGETAHPRSLVGLSGTIIDDTDAVYPQAMFDPCEAV